MSRLLTGYPNLVDYKFVISNLQNEKYEGIDDVLPTLIPNRDHSPHGGKYLVVFENCTIVNWMNHATEVFVRSSKK